MEERFILLNARHFHNKDRLDGWSSEYNFRNLKYAVAKVNLKNQEIVLRDLYSLTEIATRECLC